MSAISMYGNLKNKVVVITGGASGIGKHLAEEFAKSGASVVVADLHQGAGQEVADNLKTVYGVPTLAVGADVSNEEQVNDAFEAVEQKFGRLDILISNAGLQVIAPIVDFSFADWQKVVGVHLHGSFLTSKAAMRKMIAQKTGGRIIVTGSIHSFEASRNKAAYVAAKHALLGLVRSIAQEGIKDNISANLIAPDYVKTPLVEKQIPEQAATLGISEEEVVKKVMLGQTIDGEFTTVEEIAMATLFLAAFPTNALTGQSLLIAHGAIMR